MSKLRATINYQNRVNEEYKKKDQIISRKINNTDECILIDDEKSEKEVIFEENELLDLDNSNDDDFGLNNNSEIIISNWNQIVIEWERMLRDELEGQENIDNFYDENDEDNEDNENERNEENNYIYNQIHPAIDINAKWQITDLFVKDLEFPTLFDN
jgi:hypothetical protein